MGRKRSGKSEEKRAEIRRQWGKGRSGGRRGVRKEGGAGGGRKEEVEENEEGDYHINKYFRFTFGRQ